jgi:hypothetical protein
MDQIDYERLEEIRTQMIDLLEEAKNLVRMHAPRPVYEKAKAYWIGHIDCALDAGNYVTGPSYTMQDTLNDIPAEDDEDEEEYEDDEDTQSSDISGTDPQ